MIQHRESSHRTAVLQRNHDPAAAMAAEHLLERRLPSGRSLLLRTAASGEELHIRSARGELEVKIVLTDAGPVVTLGGGQLQIVSTDVSFRCQKFAVEAAEDLSLRSHRDVRIEASELRATTEQDIHLNGAYIRLNCTPDAPAPQAPTELERSPSANLERHRCSETAEQPPEALPLRLLSPTP